MANPFVHVELATTDLPKAKTFYSKLFDWKLEDMPMPDGTYTLISVGEGTGGGMMKHPMPGAPSMWMAYVLVDNIEAATKKAKDLGATVMKEVGAGDGYGVVLDHRRSDRCAFGAVADEEEVGAGWSARRLTRDRRSARA